MPRLLTSMEISNRFRCHAMGFTDKESAMELLISEESYKSWRERTGLSKNIKNGETSTIKRVALTADDAKNYNGDRTLKIETQRTKEPTVIVDVGLAEKLAQQANARPIIAPLEDRMKAKKLVADLCVTASRSFGGDFVRC